MRTAGFAAGLALLCIVAACSSETSTSSGDGGASDSSAGGDSSRPLPGCVREGYQCQPKGCNTGFAPLPDYYDCGNTGGSCCAKFDVDASARDANILDAPSDG